MSINVDSLSLKIISEGSEASSALLGLASSLDKLASKNVSLKQMSHGFETLSKAVSNFDTSNVERLGSIADSIAKVGAVKVPDLSSFAKGVRDLSKINTEDFAEKMQEIASALRHLNNTGLSKLISDLAVVASKSTRIARALKQASDAADNAPSAKPSGDVAANTDTEAVEETSSALGRLQRSMNEIDSSKASRSLKLLKNAANAATHPIRSLKNLISKIPLVGTALRGLTSFFKLAKFRLLRMVLTSIFNGVIESFKYLYQYGGQFASSMDSISTSTKYLSNSIVAALAPAINALAPIIDTVVDKFVSFLNIINQTIATVTGASTWTKAVRYAVAYDDSLSSAASSASALKRTLMGFDEINALNNATSGGSSSGSTVDVNSMFETVENTQTLTDLKEKFEELIGVDVDPLSESLGNLKGSFTGFFDKVKEKFEPFKNSVLVPFKNWLVETVAPELINGVSLVFDILSGADLDTILTKLKDASFILPNGVLFSTQGFEDIATVLKQAGSAIGEWWSGLTSSLKKKWDEFCAWFDEHVVEPFKNFDIKVFIDNILANTAGLLFSNFSGSWFERDRIVTIANNLLNAASSLWTIFKEAWGSDRKVSIVNELLSTASTLWTKFSESWGSNREISINNTLKNTAESLWSQFKSGWSGKTLSLSIAYDTNVGTIKTAVYKALGLSGWPKISFAARGGIVDGATLFGNTMIGEAGREAIIPLENHTEWMDGVADRIAAKLAGAVSGAAGDGQAINVIVELDGRVVGQSTVKYIRDESRAGRDPLGAYI